MQSTLIALLKYSTNNLHFKISICARKRERGRKKGSKNLCACVCRCVHRQRYTCTFFILVCIHAFLWVRACERTSNSEGSRSDYTSQMWKVAWVSHVTSKAALFTHGLVWSTIDGTEAEGTVNCQLGPVSNWSMRTCRHFVILRHCRSGTVAITRHHLRHSASRHTTFQRTLPAGQLAIPTSWDQPLVSYPPASWDQPLIRYPLLPALPLRHLLGSTTGNLRNLQYTEVKCFWVI